MTPDRIESLYLHVPFCASRCLYCDFPTSECHDDELMDAYVDALCLLIRRASKTELLGDIGTVYLGGGTPSHLGGKRLSSLIQLLAISVDIDDDVEFTMEVNPESFDVRLMRDMWALGVNRWSLGVQSFDDAVLKLLRRPYDEKRVLECIYPLKERGANISIDLICGIPDQTVESFRHDLQRAIDLDVDHVSIYPLQVEEGTPLACLIEDGTLDPVDEDRSAYMMEMAADMLEGAGLRHYEVASYAKPGRESRHNEAYWTGKGYLGLGSGASSFLSSRVLEILEDARVFKVSRKVPVHDEKGAVYAMRPRCTSSAVQLTREITMDVEVETLTRREALIEEFMLRMRRADGITHEEALSVHALEVEGLAHVVLELEKDGFIENVGDAYVPTRRGWLLGNVMYGRIWDLACSTE